MVGVDVSTTGIKLVALNVPKMTIVGYGAVDLDPQKIQASLINPDDYLRTSLQKLMAEHLIGHVHSRHAALSIPTGRTYSRTIQLPIEAEANLDDALQLEAEQYIPIATKDLYTDYQIIERNKDSFTVLFSAVPKKIVDTIVGACTAVGLEPVMIEPGISAAARLVRYTEDGHLPTIIIDVGAATTDIALFDRVVRVTGSAPVGGHTFTYKIAEKLKVSYEEAHQLKVHSGLKAGPRRAKLRAVLEPELNLIAAETRKILRYYAERLDAKTKIEQVVIVGGGSNMPGLGEFMTDALLMPVRVADPWHSLSFGKLTPPLPLFKSRFITAAGLSIIDPKEVWRD